MKNKIIVPILLLSVFLLSCMGCTNKISEAELNTLNEALLTGHKPTESGDKIAARRGQAEQLILKISEYLESRPEEKLASEWAFRRAELHFTELQETRKAVGLLEAVQRNYPDTESGPKALFLAAYLHLNELDNPEVAQNLYTKFIEIYPDHAFAKDAKLELQYIGKTPEEILRLNQQ